MREPRSFVEQSTMGELAPIDVESLDPEQLGKAAVRGIVQVHSCLEQHIAEQTKVNAAHTLASLAIREDLQKLTLAFGLRKPEEGEEKPKAHTVATWGPAKVVGVVVASVSGAAGLIAGGSALFKFLHAVWPAVAAYLAK